MYKGLSWFSIYFIGIFDIQNGTPTSIIYSFPSPNLSLPQLPIHATSLPHILFGSNPNPLYSWSDLKSVHSLKSPQVSWSSPTCFSSTIWCLSAFLCAFSIHNFLCMHFLTPPLILYIFINIWFYE